MKAEIAYLAEQKFTGEISYWFDQEECRRCLTRVFTGEEPVARREDAARHERFFERIKVWAERPEVKIRIIFKVGLIMRLEF